MVILFFCLSDFIGNFFVFGVLGFVIDIFFSCRVLEVFGEDEVDFINGMNRVDNVG